MFQLIIMHLVLFPIMLKFILKYEKLFLLIGGKFFIETTSEFFPNHAI